MKNIILKNTDVVLKGDFVYRGGSSINIASAHGASLISDDGKRYIDLEASSGACILGYRHDLIERALPRLSRLPSKPQFCESDTRLLLATKLRQLIEREHGLSGKLGFDLGGAHAVEQAIKIISSRCPYANTILSLDGAYHGRSLAIAQLSCSPRYRTMATGEYFRNIRLPVPKLKAQILGCDIATATEHCVAEVEALFGDERLGLVGGNQQLHSFIFEPILNVAGLIEIPIEYLERIITLVKDAGGSVIADEIFTGFYKTGKLFASAELLPLVDIVVFSKGLTNGLTPLSAIWVNDSSELSETYRPGTHSSTYINNEMAMAIAIEVLDELFHWNIDAFAETGKKLATILLNSIQPSKQLVVHQIVNMARMSFTGASNFDRFKQAMEHDRHLGVIAAATGLAANTLILHPSLTITEEELSSATTILQTAAAKMQA